MTIIDNNSFMASWHEYFMRHVYLAATKSKDPRSKIGAVLVREKNIVSTGYNGFPMGVKDLEDRYNNREVKYKFVAHAEFNSIVTAARFGIATLGTTLYTQGIVCNECCKSLIQGGIKELVVHKQWPNLVHVDQWVESIKISEIMLQEAGIPIFCLDKKLGLQGFLDGKKIEV